MQSMVFLYVPGIGLLQSRKHPDTAMFQVQSTTIQTCFRYTSLPFSHVQVNSTTIQPCFRYTTLPFSHVSGTHHYHSVMFQIHSTTIQSCFRYTALPFSHVLGTQHYHSVIFQVHSTTIRVQVHNACYHLTFYHLHFNLSCCGGRSNRTDILAF
jgi:hypothetical protein